MENFVTYYQAVKLKELGFDWDCGYYYDEKTQKFEPNTNDSGGELSINDFLDNNNRVWECVSAPTLAQAQKWLREVKGISILVNIATNKETYITKRVFYFNWYNSEFIFYGTSKYYYATYEEALLEGISEMLKRIEK